MLPAGWEAATISQAHKIGSSWSGEPSGSERETGKVGQDGMISGHSVQRQEGMEASPFHLVGGKGQGTVWRHETIIQGPNIQH